ncbi:MAG: murein biosynthesis integral membrane protein MurJ [Syntrophomonadaceae bacterium]|nr:murein biosynthesis integral membrane protein MurJ [Syntrophomonadaceae bacterium]
MDKPQSTITHKIARATAIIAILASLSKVLGFVREMTLAYVFGASSVTDAYLVALTVPGILFSVLGGALTVAAVPVFTSYAARNRNDEGWQVFRIFTTVLSLLIIIVVLLAIPFARQVVWLIAPGLDSSTALLASRLLAVMLPGVLFFSLANLFYGLLNANNVFSIPAAGPVVTNILIIISILAGYFFGIFAVAVGTLAGYMAAMLLQLPALRRVGFRYRFSIDLQNPGVKHTFSLMAPLMIGTGISQAYLVIDRILASGLAEGSISALNYASKLVLLPQGVIVMAVGTAVFPALATRAASGYLGQYVDTLRRSLNMVLLITLPCGVGLAVLRDPIVRLLFARGAFDERAAVMTSFALLCFSVGLIGQCLNPVITRGFYALQDTVTPVKIGVMTVGLNLVFALILVGPMKHGGLALANSIAAVFNVIVLLCVLKKKVTELDIASLKMCFFKLLAASAVMAAAVAVLDRTLVYYIPGPGIFLGLRVLLDIGAGVIIYFSACAALKLDEFYYLQNIGKNAAGRYLGILFSRSAG